MAECKDIQQGKMIVAITNQYWVNYVYIQVSRFGRVGCLILIIKDCMNGVEERCANFHLLEREVLQIRRED